MFFTRVHRKVHLSVKGLKTDCTADLSHDWNNLFRKSEYNPFSQTVTIDSRFWRYFEI